MAPVDGSLICLPPPTPPPPGDAHGAVLRSAGRSTDLGYRVPRRSDAANSTCNCARSSYHMQAAGQRTDLPQCCENGDFRAYQCRGLYCYCVDEEGVQTDDPAGAVTQNDLYKLDCTKQKCPDTTVNSAADSDIF